MTTTHDYVLGRSAEDYQRLPDQARRWEPATARLLDRLGPLEAAGTWERKAVRR
jgi:hypothetical protein